MKKLLALLALSFLSLSAFAVEVRYVTDTLFLQLRSGPSIEYRILKAIPRGEHLIVLEADESEKGEGYTKVRTDKGLEGYVLTRFLENEPVAKEKLILLQRDFDKLKAELDTTRQQRNELKAETEKLKSERSGLSSNNSNLESELEHIKKISASALELDKKYKELVNKNHELNIQIQTLSTENTQLHDNRQQTYLLYGGGLVVLGILAGLILPSLRGKRNSGWA